MKKKIINVIEIALIAILVFFVLGNLRGNPNLNNLNREDFAKKLATENYTLIDVRTVEEYNEGFIEGAKLIPIDTLPEGANEIDKDEPLLIYCQGGVRSKKAGNILIKEGYTDVSHLVGGYLSWIK